MVLGINEAEHFKRRGDFQSFDDYKGYVMTHIKHNMLVINIAGSVISSGYGSYHIPAGAIGRVIDFDINRATVKWSKITTPVLDRQNFTNLSLLTPPIDTSLFKD